MKKSNILIIVCDQLSATALRAYGNTYAKTPNIDALLKKGVRFEHAYCSYPLCQPARASFWTGLYPHSTGVTSNGRNIEVDKVSSDIPTLGSLFSDAGYLTVHYGKAHDAGSLRGFEVVKPNPKREPQDPNWELRHEAANDASATEQMVDFLDSYNQPSPFLAVADLQNPHNICSWIGRYSDSQEFEPCDDLPALPENLYIDDFEKRPKPVQYICCAHNRQAQVSKFSEEGVRQYLKAYHGYMTQVDIEVGKILNALNKRSDADDTTIVFFSDHGDSMFGRWMATKHTSFYDETTRIPFAFVGPTVNGEDRVVRGPVSQLDLLPTLCESVGIDVPQKQHGRSLLPWLKEKRNDQPNKYVASQWYSEWGFTIEPGRMLRTERYKYTCYREEEGEELYDLENDPLEMKTLIDDPKYAEILKEHRELFALYIKETDDDFLSLDWKADKRWRSHVPGFRCHEGPAAPQV